MEERLRVFDTQILEIGKWRFTQHRLATALQRACARRQRVGGLLQREAFLEMVACPTFEAKYEGVRLGQVIGDDIGRLRGAYVGEQVA